VVVKGRINVPESVETILQEAEGIFEKMKMHPKWLDFVQHHGGWQSRIQANLFSISGMRKHLESLGANQEESLQYARLIRYRAKLGLMQLEAYPNPLPVERPPKDFK
jgi:2-phospho-L-lactate transferase/gluconeogenesis factor (CofD/UPF0052 family)